MKTQLLKLIRGAAVVLTVSVIAILFLMALLRATAPAVSSELPSVTRFLGGVVGKPVQIQSLQLRWRRFLPVLDLHDVTILGDTPSSIGEIKLGWHFILLKDFTLDASSSSMPTLGDSSYFKHVVLEDAAIKTAHLNIKLTYLSLHKKYNGSWAWEGRGLNLDFGKLFLAPIFLNATTGEIQLSSGDNSWRIVADDIAATNEDATVLAKVSLVKLANASPVIDLTARYDVYSHAVKDLKNYLPQTIINPELAQWLMHSVKSMGSASGKFILKGPLNDFPYDKKPGQFLVDSEISNGELNYFKGWPCVTQINAELIFSNAAMQIHTHSAVTAYTPVKNIEVKIPNLIDNQILSISGNVSTRIENGLYFIAHSPLQATVGKRLSELSWTGPMTLGLEIKIPFAKKIPTTVNGAITLKNSTLSFPVWKVSLNSLSGLINFTERDFSSPGLTAMYNQDPVSISIDKNSTYHVKYKKYNAEISSLSSNGWRAKISSSAWRGMFLIPSNVQQAGIKGTLYYFNADANNLSALNNQIKPSSLPPLNIEIQNLRYKSIRFDSISFVTQPMVSGLFARFIQISGPNYGVVGQGKWFDNQQSWFNGRLTTTDIAKMIASWGLNPSIRGNSGQLNFSLEWPGQLYSPNLKGLSGDVNINIGNGEMVTTGSQARMDFGRLVTILSFQSLQRRLSLDFSDITQKGLAFDSIKGNVQLKGNGIATVKSIVLNSPVATVELTGDIYLLLESYRLIANVTPHLTSSLPVIAALAGGPVAGAAVWAASKVVDPILNQVTEDKYSVTGPWKNPTIKKA
ncbi:MAG: DUF3971 domain-containing protein [Gammaproteobacteria bacterium]|nr:DUF3971 domain-containing protein [Gammaproteobacteria bacterium]